jgi:hypothetical protein
MKKVINKTTGQGIYDVQIYDSDANGIITEIPRGTISDFDGFFNFIPNANYITFRHLSFKMLTISKSTYNSMQNIQLEQSSTLLPEVVIEGERIKKAVAGISILAILGIILYNIKS